MKLPSRYQQDCWKNGIIAVLVTELPVILLWWVIVVLCGQIPILQLRWIALAFVPPVLLLRRLAKKQQSPSTTKGAIVTLFVTFIIFIVLYLKNA